MSDDLFKPFDTKSKMNEHALRLFEESKELRNTEWGESITYVNFYTFTKLIVEECAAIADSNYNSGFAPTGDDIRKHFGVK